MKKMKIALTALVVLSTVGAALAFKAYKGENLWCIYPESNGNCLFTTSYSTTDSGPAVPEVSCTVIPPVSVEDCDLTVTINN